MSSAFYTQHPTAKCGAVLGTTGRKNSGRVCGRAAVTFLAPGHGRCGYHDTVIERTRLRAILDAARDTFALRAHEDRGREDDQQTKGDDGADRMTAFDAEDFACPSLDE